MKRNDQSIRILFTGGFSSDLDEALQEITNGGIDFTYKTAKNEPDFKKLIRCFKPDLIISEYLSEPHDGLKALEIAKSGNKNLPFIFLITPVKDGEAQGLKNAGADACVLKSNLPQLPVAIKTSVGITVDGAEQVEKEDLMGESEEMYIQLMENSANAIFLMKDGKLKFINHEFEKMFGYTFQEAVQEGFDILKIVASESREYVENKIREMLSGEGKTYRFEFTTRTKRNELKEVEISISHIKFQEKLITQGIIRDITAKKITEEQLKESEKKFRTLFQNHSAVKLIIDPETGHILEANDAAARFYGLPVNILQNMNMSEILMINPEDFRKNLRMAGIQNNVFSEYTHYKSDGRPVDVEVFSSNISLGGKNLVHSIIHDISEKKKTEQNLLLLKRAVEQNPIAIVITDPGGKIEYINPAFTNMTGYELEEVEGKTLSVLKSGLQSEDFYRNLWNTISSGRDWSAEYRNRKKNGEVYWQETVISPILNDKNVITHFVAVMEDIAGKKKLIEDLMLSKEKAEESDRLKSAFLANMSHEIRTPMNGIIGFTNLLKEQKLTGEERSKYIDIIKKSSERMLSTINDLIEISKIESGAMDFEISEVNINELMEFLKHFFIPEAETKGLEMYFHPSLPYEIARIETDYDKLNSILTNLVKNAIKYTSAGRIDFGYRMNRNQIEFFVKDTGIGIEKNRQQIIFDRFVQADLSLSRPYEGAGLGLSIAKGYTRILGGDIWVESELHKGSKFYVTIPIKNKLVPVVKSAVAETVQEEKNILKNLTVLVAEDDAIGKLYLSELLKDTCKKVVFASNGVEALKVFSETPETDVVLMDIKMPGLNGYQTAQKMKETNKEVVIIAQTAYALSGDKEKALASGCDAYLSKPFTKDQLLQVIENIFVKRSG